MLCCDSVNATIIWVYQSYDLELAELSCGTIAAIVVQCHLHVALWPGVCACGQGGRWQLTFRERHGDACLVVSFGHLISMRRGQRRFLKREILHMALCCREKKTSWVQPQKRRQGRRRAGELVYTFPSAATYRSRRRPRCCRPSARAPARPKKKQQTPSTDLNFDETRQPSDLPALSGLWSGAASSM